MFSALHFKLSICIKEREQSHTNVFPQPACYLLEDSCLNTTQAPIKIPKTKNYNSCYIDAQSVEKVNEGSAINNKTVHAFLSSDWMPT